MNSSHFLTILLFASLACECINGNSNCFQEHSSLLLDLKHGFTLPPGELASWEPSSDCCGWEGITCDPKSGHVIRLDLSGRSIAGGINSHALFGLTSLQSLNLSNNEFGRINLSNTGFYPISIPQPGFENLKELRQLDLYKGGGFVGQIPIGIARLARLEYLDLSACYQRIGTLEMRNPNFSRMIRNLNNLRVLKLRCVDLHQDPEWSTALGTWVPQLQVLDLYYTNLTGQIPNGISRLVRLEYLDLAGAGFQGQIPNGISRLARLEYLHLAACYQPGPSLELRNPNFSRMIRNLNNLRVLKLGCVDLHQDVERVTTALLTSAPHLQVLDLQQTNLTGTIPESFGNLKNLTEINLSENTLTGVIPPSIGKLVKLTSLCLIDNSLTGPIPGSLFSLPLLQSLYLPYNQLSGELDVSLNVSTSLVYIQLSNNQLCGQIPPTFFYLPSLKILILYSNNFSGAIELDRIAILNNLEDLELSHNNLSLGEFDDNNFLSLPNLRGLRLVSCGLTKVPAFLKNHKNMEFLDLSNNRIGPDVPRWIWSSTRVFLDLSHNRLKHIEGSEDMPISRFNFLDLSSNMLHGPVPIPPPSVKFVDFSNNSFSSAIPPEFFFNLSNMHTFLAANSNISGEIPPSICNAPYLYTLDLSNNIFNGSIPSCLFESGHLTDVNLGRNMLEGIIPRNITWSCQLSSLILSDNHLEGSLPRSLVNCSNLKVLDLGSNHMVDTFPFWLGDQASLQVLSLRANRFYGPLRPSESREANYTFPNLQIFDLSSNNFSGKLSPKSFSGLRRMMNLTSSPLIINGNAPDSFFRFDIVVIKGQDIPLLKIFYTVVDFSNNRFEGDITPLIGGLHGLNVLNLSHNSLTGNIPFELGNLTQLQSLDLSTNHLSGEIPQCLSSLTFLEWLNLSNNNLSGRIPQDGQFSTFLNASYFQGNPELCGIQLSKQCGNTIPNTTNAMPSAVISDHSSSSSSFVIVLALFIGIGFGVGMALVIVLQNIPLKSLRQRVGSCY